MILVLISPWIWIIPHYVPNARLNLRQEHVRPELRSRRDWKLVRVGQMSLTKINILKYLTNMLCISAHSISLYLAIYFYDVLLHYNTLKSSRWSSMSTCFIMFPHDGPMMGPWEAHKRLAAPSHSPHLKMSLAFEKKCGFDPIWSLIPFAKDNQGWDLKKWDWMRFEKMSQEDHHTDSLPKFQASHRHWLLHLELEAPGKEDRYHEVMLRGIY